MQVIQEYYNLLSTDIKNLIVNASDKASTLSTFTNQLEHRYKLATTNIATLNIQKAQHIQELETIQTQVTNIKAKINNDFKNFDARSTDKNITSYLSLKGKYDFHRTHVIFINQYIKQYDFLNNYNKKVLDVLLTNRNAIIKSSYVVIPDTGSEVLRDMNLLITEQEFKGE